MAAQHDALAALVGRALTVDETAQIEGHLSDPLGRRDDLIAALLSTGRTQLGTVSVGDLASWAAVTDMRAVIEDHAVNAESPLRSIALALRDVLVGGASGVRLDLPANAAMLGAWVSAGLLSTENRDALFALASIPSPITVEQVSDALNKAGG